MRTEGSPGSPVCRSRRPHSARGRPADHCRSSEMTAAHTASTRSDRNPTAPGDLPVSADPKYAVPLATHVVPRPRLYERLTAGRAAPVTLLSAPAGWGKTLLVSSWLADRTAEGAAAWISL